MKNLKEKSLKIFGALFGGKTSVSIADSTYSVEKYTPSGVKHVDVGKYRFIEQNPKKESHWAAKARKGQRIMWILKDWDYIGQVHEGKFKHFENN